MSQEAPDETRSEVMPTIPEAEIKGENNELANVQERPQTVEENKLESIGDENIE